MPLLYYWRPDNYMRDLDNGSGYHLNQLNPLMHSIDIGDTLWAFTRNKRGGYAIVAKLLVKAKTINPLKFRYGRYRLWGDLTSSKFYTGRDLNILFLICIFALCFLIFDFSMPSTSQHTKNAYSLTRT